MTTIITEQQQQLASAPAASENLASAAQTEVASQQQQTDPQQQSTQGQEQNVPVSPRNSTAVQHRGSRSSSSASSSSAGVSASQRGVQKQTKSGMSRLLTSQRSRKQQSGDSSSSRTAAAPSPIEVSDVPYSSFVRVPIVHKSGKCFRARLCEVIIGDNNTIYCDSHVIVGNNNKIIGNRNRIAGRNNVVENGIENVVVGPGCSIRKRPDRNVQSNQDVTAYIRSVMMSLSQAAHAALLRHINGEQPLPLSSLPSQQQQQQQRTSPSPSPAPAAGQQQQQQQQQQAPVIAASQAFDGMISGAVFEMANTRSPLQQQRPPSAAVRPLAPIMPLQQESAYMRALMRTNPMYNNSDDEESDDDLGGFRDLGDMHRLRSAFDVGQQDDDDMDLDDALDEDDDSSSSDSDRYEGGRVPMSEVTAMLARQEERERQRREQQSIEASINRTNKLFKHVQNYADEKATDQTPDEQLCQLCSENKYAQVMIDPCGHTGVCVSCVRKWVESLTENDSEARPPCPLCRVPMKTLKRFYGPGIIATQPAAPAASSSSSSSNTNK